MSPVPMRKPVEDSVPKVNNDVAVGEDLEFQNKWWRFERAVWVVFAMLVILDLLGAFGRGYLAHNKLHTADTVMEIKYDRIQRFGTPSNLEFKLGPGAFHDGKAQLFVSESVISDLGAQRISPQPLMSTVGGGGVLYSFPVTTAPATVHIALQPSKPGLYRASFQVPGSEALETRIFVMP